MPDLRGYPDDLLARLEADCALAGPPVAAADVERTLKAARSFLGSDPGDGPLEILPDDCLPPADALVELGLEVVEGE